MTSSRPHLGIFTTDANLVIRTWDSRLAEMTGIEAEQALGRPITSVVPDLEERGLVPVFRQVLADGVVQLLAPALHRYLIACSPSDPAAPATDRMPQCITIGPIREDGRITGVAVTIEDATTSSAAAHALASLTRALGDPDWRTRRAAVRDLASQGEAIVETLVATLREQHRNFSVLSSLLDLLATTNLDFVEPLIRCLRDPDVDLRIQAALILGERRDRRAVPALIAALDDADVNVRFHAIEALGHLHATEAVERFVEIAASGDFFLAFPAIQALARLGDPGVAPRLVPLLQDELLGAAVAETLGELGDELVVVPLVGLLNQAGAPTDVVADALSSVYERYEDWYSAGEHIASVVRRTVAAIGTQNLLDAVDRVEAGRLRGIARVLGWLNGAAVERALARLIGHRAVRARVVEALVRYGAGVVTLLIDQLRADDLETRQAAAVALGRIGGAK